MARHLNAFPQGAGRSSRGAQMAMLPPIALVFAATDPTGGAGLQADILTLAAILFFDSGSSELIKNYFKVFVVLIDFAVIHKNQRALLRFFIDVLANNNCLGFVHIYVSGYIIANTAICFSIRESFVVVFTA